MSTTGWPFKYILKKKKVKEKIGGSHNLEKEGEGGYRREATRLEHRSATVPKAYNVEWETKASTCHVAVLSTKIPKMRELAPPVGNALRAQITL